MTFWVEIGLDPDAFWRQTPKLFSALVAGRLNAMKREHREFAWLAWHMAVLPNVKTMPTIDDLAGSKPIARRQSPAEVKSVFQSMRDAAA